MFEEGNQGNSDVFSILHLEKLTQPENYYLGWGKLIFKKEIDDVLVIFFIINYIMYYMCQHLKLCL